MQNFQITLDTEAFRGTLSLNTGLFIDGKFIDAVDKGVIDVVNPATGKLITPVCAGNDKDVDLAVEAAQKAYKTLWGTNVAAPQRGRRLNKLADLMEAKLDEFAALESLNVGKPFSAAKGNVTACVGILRYYAGWADKIHGETIETSDKKMAYTRHEPYGVVGLIIPWNFPVFSLCLKIAPAVVTGNTVVIKPSEITPLTALMFAGLLHDAGFPPGVINIVNGYGATAGTAIASHSLIRKISFTGSTVTGRKIQEASAKSNLKDVSLELGGKSPNIIFDDADLDQAVKWAAKGVFANMGQICSAGSRIFVQEAIYDQFLQAFSAAAQSLQEKIGDPFSINSQHGPQVSKTQFERVMDYIASGKSDGAKAYTGGAQHGETGFFIQPTIFTDVKPEMRIMREEIFGPVAAVVKFKTEREVIEMANDTTYGLACAVFTENASRAVRVAHALEAGTAFINCYDVVEVHVPFGGYKQSGNGKDLGAHALETYTQVKAVHFNLKMKL